MEALSQTATTNYLQIVMETRSMTMEDYPLLCKWWEHFGWPPVLPAMLPKSTGVMVWKGDRPILASFLYLPREGCIAWMEWTVANPESSSEDRQAALELCLSWFKEIARSSGVYSIYTNTPVKKFGERLEKAGFQRTDEGVNYILPVPREET